jgi:hypothetical protein
MIEGILVIILFWGGIFFIGWVINTISDLSKKHKEKVRDQVAQEVLNGMDIKTTIESYKNKLAIINCQRPDPIGEEIEVLRTQFFGRDAILIKDCPECKEGSLIVRKGKYGKFLGCTKYPNCKYTSKITEAREEYKKNINEQVVEDIQRAYLNL